MSAFSVDDLRLLEKTISIRERMIDNLLKNDLPTKARDIDSYTNLLESVDRSILNKAKVSIEENSNKINEETKSVLTDLLKHLHSENESAPTPAPDSQMSQENIPQFKSSGMELNSGLLVPKTDNQNIEDVLS